MKRSLIISGTAHAILLLWGLVAFAARPNEAPQTEALPVEFVSATEFSQLTAGVRNAPKPIENAKPLADKVGDPKPVKELAPKVADKPEIKTESAPPPSPEPKLEPKSPTKSAEKAEPKPDPKPAEKPEKKDTKPNPDQIADALKKDEAKKPPKPEKKQPEFKPDQIAEALKKDEAKKPPSKFDANQVAALLDHREPQRQVATAETLNGAASLGTSTGHAAHLSQSELEALRAKLISLWNPPAAISTHPDQYVVTIRIRLSRDHRLNGQPEVLTNGDGPLFEATRDSAVRAVFQAQPYDMLSQTTYDQWKEMDINFDPREVFGG
jgi:colicin import membrane protein